MYKLFDACSCCGRELCNWKDWKFVGHIRTDMFTPFLCEVEICLKAPCDEEISIWKDEYQFEDLNEIRDMVSRLLKDYNDKWKKIFVFPLGQS